MLCVPYLASGIFKLTVREKLSLSYMVGYLEDFFASFVKLEYVSIKHLQTRQ